MENKAQHTTIYMKCFNILKMKYFQLDNAYKLVFVLMMLMSSCVKQETNNISNTDQLLYQKVDKLLAQMTFEEKLGQMSQIVLMEVTEQTKQDIKDGKIGSLLITKRTSLTPELKNSLQKIAIEESRLGIPIIFGHDVIHGFITILPTSLAQSCTWDTMMVRQCAAMAAKEASAYGVDWTFAPMIDVSRDARWGRIAECFGEDTYLNECFGVASVKGFQGSNPADADRLVACLKHFVGYGAALGGRDYQYTDISERSMHEVYLPPFKACVNAGCLTVMSGFNDINGVPASANKKYLSSILKEKWKFPGFVVSDWDAVEQLQYHGFASDSVDAAIKAFKSGVDMEMKSQIAYKLKPENINIDVLNQAVRRILFVKFKKGQFDNPYVDENRAANDILTKKHRQLSRKIASESMVLLENKDQILPIENKSLTVAVVGPFAKERNIMGWWKSFGHEKDVITAYEGIKANAPSNVKVVDNVTSATDIIVVCVGEEYDTFGEDHSRSKIDLPNGQSDMIAKLKKYGKPIVSVVFNGRPLVLTSEKENSNALLLAWHPGTEGGNALADILFGVKNPSAKLTTTFPAKTGHIPVYYNVRNSGRPLSNKYMNEEPKPLYPFGFGLSYTSFIYSDLKFESPKIGINEILVVSAKITNSGKKEGVEVVQLYIRDMVGSTTRPLKELKGFKRVSLKAGETKEVKFELPASALAVLDEDMKAVVEKGEFKVWIAPNSTEGLEGEFLIE
jgi:beta-glucosidase